MTTHELKIEPRWFDRIRAHQKTAEVRYDDRDYQTGDTLRLQRSDRDGSSEQHYIQRTITHVLRACDGLEDGYVVLSLEDPRVGDLMRERCRLFNDIAKHERSNAALRGANRRLGNK